MISVITCTNRKDSRSSIIAKYYYEQLSEMTEETVEIFHLNSLEQPFMIDNNYNEQSQSKQLKEIQDKYFIGANKWIFVIPEYNGGLPGVFKYVLDGMSIREYAATFSKKKIALVGISNGRAGNLRGLDYATNLLNYLKAEVYANKLPISQISTLLDENGVLTNEDAKKSIQAQLEGFLAF